MVRCSPRRATSVTASMSRERRACRSNFNVESVAGSFGRPKVPRVSRRVSGLRRDGDLSRAGVRGRGRPGHPQEADCPEATPCSVQQSSTRVPVPAATATRGAPAVNPYADLDDDKPYAMVDPPPAAAAASESRRPCPACGEFILTTAAKCRFCGEVFDAVLKTGRTQEAKEIDCALARPADGDGVRDLLLGFVSFVLGLGLTLVSFANAACQRRREVHGLLRFDLGGIVGMLRGIWGLARSGR